MACQGTFRKTTTTDMDGTRHDFDFESCTYCGSISIDAAIKAFQTPRTNWSGSDWKYGFPHKWYVDVQHDPIMRVLSSTMSGGVTTYGEKREVRSYHGKFYVTHLDAATPEQWIEWVRFVEPVIGIRFEMTDGKLMYRAPYHGYQAYGVIVSPGKSEAPDWDVPRTVPTKEVNEST